MQFGRQRVSRNAKASGKALPWETKTQQYQPWQRDTVGSQLHPLPISLPTAQAPAIVLMSQTTPRTRRRQKDAGRNDPDDMQKAKQHANHAQPSRHRQRNQCNQGKSQNKQI